MRWRYRLLAVLCLTHVIAVAAKKNKQKRADMPPSTAALMKWLRAGGLKDEKVQVTHMGGMRGMLATEELHAGEQVLSVPLRLFISVKSARESQSIGGALAAEAALLQEDRWKMYATLVLHLLYEWYNRNRSFWGAYLPWLPQDIDTPIFWQQSDLEELQGSFVDDDVRSNQQLIEEMHEKVISVFSRKFPALFPARKFTLHRTAWAMAIIWSRAVHCPIDGERTFAIVPFLDFLNHKHPLPEEADPQPPSALFDPKTQSYIINTAHATAKGAEVFVSYGRKPNFLLLLDYGFALHHNPYDEIRLSFSLTPSAALYGHKMHFFKQCNFDKTVFSALGTVPSSTLKAARLFSCNKEELEHLQLPQLLQGDIISQRNEEEALLLLQNAAQGLLDGYKGTTSDQDRQLLNTNLSPRHRGAVTLRLGEKKVLERTLDMLVKARQKLLSRPTSMPAQQGTQEKEKAKKKRKKKRNSA